MGTPIAGIIRAREAFRAFSTAPITFSTRPNPNPKVQEQRLRLLLNTRYRRIPEKNRVR